METVPTSQGEKNPLQLSIATSLSHGTEMMDHFLLSVPAAAPVSLGCQGASWSPSPAVKRPSHLHHVGAISSRHEVKGQTELPGKIEAFLGHLHIR